MIEPHEIADIFPMMPEDELHELADDIKANGQRDVILLFEGKILDGRNRYLACQMAGVEPRTMDWNGEDPLAFVVSRNLHRRHLNTSQRGMVAARIANMKPGYRSDLQEPSANLRKVVMSQSDAAEQLNVSRRTVTAASHVLKEDPELAERVAKGEISAHRAERRLAARGVDRADRAERIRAMLDMGHRSSVIAAEVGVGVEVVNRTIREMGLTPVHDRIGRTRRVDLERAMDAVIDTARIPQPSLDVFAGHWEELPKDRIPDWIERLTEDASLINGLKRELIKLAVEEGAE